MLLNVALIRAPEGLFQWPLVDYKRLVQHAGRFDVEAGIRLRVLPHASRVVLPGL
jgi:hypothetical protein